MEKELIKNLKSIRFVLLGIGLFFLAHLATISISPVFWGDETWIVEFGRLLYEPDTDWSSILDSSNEIRRYSVGVCYLGAAVHYWIFSIFGSLGPRIFELLCFCLLGIAVYLMGRKKTRNAFISVLVITVILSDPYLNQAIRGTRCDAFALLMCVAAIYYIECAKERYNTNRTQFWVCLTLSFVSIIMACFIWITAWVASLAYATYCLLAIQDLGLNRRDWIRLIMGSILICLAVLLLYIIIYPGSFWDSISYAIQTVRQQTKGEFTLSKGLLNQVKFFCRSHCFTFPFLHCCFPDGNIGLSGCFLFS